MYCLDYAGRHHPGNQLSFMLHELVLLGCHLQFASYIRIVVKFYTILQNKRMRRCPPIIFERLKLPQQIIHRRKENLSESPNHKNIGKMFWFRDFMSNFREIDGI